MPAGVVSVIRGPEHCGWDSALLLGVGWPLGTNAVATTDLIEFVRDPDGVLPGRKQGSFAAHVQVPDDAVFSGYQKGELQLWLPSANPPGEAYLVLGEMAERWPAVDEAQACG